MIRSVHGVMAACVVASIVPLRASPPTEEAVARGEFLYRVHCAACHGSAGQGDGPVTGELKTPPPDLTRLRDETDAFPAERTRSFIDGREDIASHGSREMPIWGLTFQDRGRPGEQENEVAGRIDDLVQYLRSIQRK